MSFENVSKLRVATFIACLTPVSEKKKPTSHTEHIATMLLVFPF
jgi:hypothetical protein